MTLLASKPEDVFVFSVLLKHQQHLHVLQKKCRALILELQWKKKRVTLLFSSWERLKMTLFWFSPSFNKKFSFVFYTFLIYSSKFWQPSWYFGSQLEQFTGKKIQKTLWKTWFKTWFFFFSIASQKGGLNQARLVFTKENLEVYSGIKR